MYVNICVFQQNKKDLWVRWSYLFMHTLVGWFALNIDPKIAPSLQRHQHDLERNILQDKLEHKIQERPNPVELVEQGILTGK